MRKSAVLASLLLFLLVLPAFPLQVAHAATSATVEDAYAVAKTPTSLTAQWTVPSAPSTTADNQAVMLYDAISNCGSTSDYIRAVLQWGWTAYAGGGQSWMIYPQWVSGYCSTFTNGNEVQVSSGDVIQGSMSKNPTTGYWTISVTDLTTGKSTSYTPQQTLNFGTGGTMTFPSVLQVQNVKTCSDYPATSPTTFGSIQLYNSSVQLVPTWSPSVLVSDGCGENVVVNSGSSISLYYQPATSTTYSVTFNESGLPSGTSWSITFNGATQASTSTGIVFNNLASGTYSWSASSPISGGAGTRYTASPTSGSLAVSSSVTQAISYSAQYLLTTTSSPSGGGTVSPASSWYNAASSVPITATSNSGYSFGSWTGSGPGSYSGSNNPTTVTLNGPITQTANFMPGLTISAGAGGSVSYSYGTTAGTVPSGTSTTVYVVAGTSVSLTATPASGYTFAGWSGSLSGTANPMTFAVNSPATVSASFSSSTSTATVTFSQTGLSLSTFGTILTVDGIAYSTLSSPLSFTWSVGTLHTFAWSSPIAGGTGIQFVWTGTSGLSTAQSGSITVSSSGGSVSATYATQYQVTFAPSPSSGGTTSPSGTAWYNSGTLLSILAMPASGYAFASWSAPSSIALGSPTSAATTATIGGSGTVTASFGSTSTCTTSCTVTFYEVGLPSGTRWSVTFFGYLAASTGSSISFTGIASGTYSWSTSSVSCGTGCQYSPSPTGGSMSVPTVTSQTISFTEQFQVTMASTTGGTTSPASGSSMWVNAGGGVSVSATPSSGYAFSSWSASTGSISFASPTSATTTASVNAAGTITANFGTSTTTYTVTFSESGLAAGTLWGVTFNGASQSSTSSSIAFTNVGSGTYLWSTAGTIGCGAGCQYVASVSSGSMGVPTQTTQTVSYTTQYQVTMAATSGGTTSPTAGSSTWVNSGGGLAIGANPSVGYAFSSWTSSSLSIMFASSSSSSTTATIKGAGTITANFVVVSATYTVTFAETGLPSGTSWSVTFDGVTQTGTSTSIAFSSVASGTYAWSVSTPSCGSGCRYSPSPASGSISVTSTASINVGYVTQYQVTMASTAGGSTSPAAGTIMWVNAGGFLAISATANSGYLFSGWTASTTSITISSPLSASTTAAASAPGTITANFVVVTPPVVTITSPSNGAVVSAVTTVAVSASGSYPISKVQLYVDGVLYSTDTATPYTFSWSTASFTEGPHTLVAKAVDTQGNTGTSISVSVTVDNGPSLSYSYTVTGHTLSVAASPTSPFGIQKVQFYVDGILLATDTASPYTFSDKDSGQPTTHTITLIAYDDLGYTKTVSFTVDF